MGRNRTDRERFFAANGFGPYKCDFCGEVVSFEVVTVHHRNHDPSDHRLENLGPAHTGCHNGHHTRDRHRNGRMPKTAGGRGTNWTPERRQAAAERSATRWRDPEFKARVRASMSAEMKERWKKPEYRERRTADLRAYAAARSFATLNTMRQLIEDAGEAALPVER